MVNVYTSNVNTTRFLKSSFSSDQEKSGGKHLISVSIIEILTLFLFYTVKQNNKDSVNLMDTK